MNVTKVKIARMELGLTQPQVAKVLNMDVKTYLYRENQPDKFKIGEAKQLANFLGKDFNELFM